ncbi:MAG TPA: hypothetical protein VIX73_22915 [Kofleriaceae bacterium]
MNRSIVMGSALACTLGLGVSCQIGPDSGGPAVQAPPAAPRDQVELLDPGRAPRAPLRYTFQPGTHEPFIIISGGSDYRAGRVYVSSDVRVEAVLPDGSARLEVVEGHPSDTGAQPASANAPTHVGIDTRGLRVEDGPGSFPHDPDYLLAPLPVEPVGVGARWRIDTSKYGPTTTTYELVGLEPAGAVLHETRTRFSTILDPARSDSVPVGTQRTDLTGDRHVQWNRVVSRTDWRFEGHPRPLAGHALHSSQVDYSSTQSHLPASALVPPAFFPGDLAPILTAMIAPSLCTGTEGPFLDASAAGGAPTVAGTCKDGQSDGRWRWSDASGELIAEGDFHAGRPDGTWKQLDHGHALGSFTLRDGTGAVTLWWPSGHRRLHVDFVDGVPHGDFATWSADGTPDVEGHFETPCGQGIWLDRHNGITRTWTLDAAGRLSR